MGDEDINPYIIPLSEVEILIDIIVEHFSGNPLEIWNRITWLLKALRE